MDTATLQTPTTGRSRFSKALPLPPGLDLEGNGSQAIAANQVPRALPDLPNMAATVAFPPRKDSVGGSFVPKPLDSPLPALPALTSGLDTQKKMPPIPRKAVASPPAQPAKTTPAHLKRVSSISSLLSAYSNTSSDSVHRSSQGSSVTKGSEPSFSPEREAMQDGNKDDFTRSYKAYSRNPYEEPSEQEKAVMMNEPLPPPPPFKSNLRPTTPRTGLPATPRSGRTAASPTRDANADSPTTSMANASPPRREIWRRRASSKSDRSIAVAGLKLSISHGSTAATTAPVAAPAQLSLPKSAMTNNDVKTTSPLPPKPNSGLPGRNIRPQPQQAEADDEMKRLKEKLKPFGLGRSGTGEQADARMSAQSNDAPAPPAKDSPTIKAASSETIKVQPAPVSDEPNKPLNATASPLSSPEPQRDSANSIRRRDVGAPARKQASMQNMNAKMADPAVAQDLRGAKSHVDLKGASHGDPRDQLGGREIGTKDFGTKEDIFRNADIREPREPKMTSSTPVVAAAPPPAKGLPSPRSRRPSQPQPRRIPPELMITTAPEPVVYRDINEDPHPIDPEQQAKLEEAINTALASPSKFNFTPTEDGVWPALALSINHYQCLGSHKLWHCTQNANYPIRCMVCHVPDKTFRFVCRCCGVRCCQGCMEALRVHPLEALDLDGLRKGKQVVSPVREDLEAEIEAEIEEKVQEDM
ncbi:hypothetical protein JX265_002548 [Neoarthrinium moseri]|uniref:Uncharacterized protein n=1 Tax=Neoarthrinium moseri TaxID=1658444 RepID=A0A9Q0AQH7_9PEZI|nr:hypothetical protein JX265_002548 [Neoarthrinium moseri]